MEVAGGKGPSSEGYVEVRMRMLILFMTDLGVDTRSMVYKGHAIRDKI